MSKMARRKLDEAKYFLDKMRDTKGDDAFFFNLSAYFSAARSVTFYLQKEYGDNQDFKEWYSLEQEKMGENPLFEIVKDTRNYVLKESYPEIRSMQITSPTSDVQQAIIYGNIEKDIIESQTNSEADVKYYLNIHKISGIDWDTSTARRPICDLSDEALRALEDLVSRWEASEN